MEFSPKKSAKIFIVCCILHNILMLNGELDEFEVFYDNDDDVAYHNDENVGRGDHNGEKKRKLLSNFCVQFEDG